MTEFIIGFFVGGIAMCLIAALMFVAKDKNAEVRKDRCDTYRDRLMFEHQDCVGSKFNGGCKDCPATYGYESVDEGRAACKMFFPDCAACWDREVKR